MPGSLSALSGAPPAPNPISSQPQPQGMGGPLSGGAPAMGAGGQGAPQAPPPPPSHQQTVVALRHFSAIEKELSGLLADPDLGKADMKSQIIDGATKLVAGGILTPVQAVTQLGAVPTRPYDQKAWLEKNFAQTVQAQRMVLAHHGAAFAGQQVDAAPTTPGNHADAAAALATQYKGSA